MLSGKLSATVFIRAQRMWWGTQRRLTYRTQIRRCQWREQGGAVQLVLPDELHAESRCV